MKEKMRVNTTWKIRKGPDWFDESAQDITSCISIPHLYEVKCNFQVYDDFKEKGIDEVYCMSVNDSFVMNAWRCMK